MRAGPTNDGGREAEGDTPWLSFLVVDGKVERWEVYDPREAKMPHSDASALARALMVSVTGSDRSCSCGRFVRYIERLGIEGVRADLSAVAQRLQLEARRRVDELDRVAERAAEQTERAREAVDRLDDAAAVEAVQRALG